MKKFLIYLSGATMISACSQDSYNDDAVLYLTDYDYSVLSVGDTIVNDIVCNDFYTVIIPDDYYWVEDITDGGNKAPQVLRSSKEETDSVVNAVRTGALKSRLILAIKPNYDDSIREAVVTVVHNESGTQKKIHIKQNALYEVGIKN